MSKKSGGGRKTFTAYRSADTGRFKTEAQAKQMKPENVVREQVPKSGRGDTGRGKK